MKKVYFSILILITKENDMQTNTNNEETKDTEHSNENNNDDNTMNLGNNSITFIKSDPISMSIFVIIMLVISGFILAMFCLIKFFMYISNYQDK